MDNLKRQSINNLKRVPRIFFVLTIFGILNLLAMLSRSTWVDIRGIDAVRLIATGMCFGAAIVSFVVYFRDRQSS